ncbi:MAG: cupin domain-containing protein, partial [Asticcacaulis sp.]
QQFDQEDQSRIRIDTRAAPWARGLVDGLSVLSLHAFETEHVALVRWAQHTRFTPHRHWGGEEIFVLEGVFRDEHGDYPAGTWIRSPHLSMHTPWTGAEGALIYVKTGHLGEQPPRQNDNPSR